MRKQVALIVVLLMVVVVPYQVNAAQALHIGFEGFSMTHFEGDSTFHSSSGDYVLLGEFTLSLPSEKHVGGVTVALTERYVDDGDGASYGGTEYVKVVVNGVESVGSYSALGAGGEGTFTRALTFTGVSGTTFDIKVYARAQLGDPDDAIEFALDDVYVYTLEEDYAIKSKLTQLKYVPPGADGTSSGFLLNQTELHFPQTYTLSEGAISFWVKWDGSDVTIADGIKVKKTYDDGRAIYGGIVVTNSDGTQYELDNVLTPGVYTKVYIGWNTGEGYISVGNSTIKLNWEGTLELSKIGDLNDDSQTIIDEFYLYDSYVSLDDLKTPNTAAMVVSFPNGTAHVTLESDAGALENLTVSLYTLNNTLLESKSWSGVGTDLTFTTNESMVLAVLSASGGSTTVLVRPNVNETVAVPGADLPHIQAVIEPSSYPTSAQRQWSWLLVRDAQGRVVYFNKWNFEGTPVLMKSGESYLVAVATENLTSVYGAYFGLASPSIQITLPKPTDLTRFTNITVFYAVKESENTFRIYFYDPSGQTSKVRVVLYDGGLNPTANLTYHASLVDIRFNYLPFKFTLTYTRNGQEYVWSRTLGYTNAQNVASELGSRKLLGFALIEGMLFAFGSLSAMWAPAVTLAFAIPLSATGMIELPALIVTYLGGMAFFAWFQQVNLDAASLKQLAVKLLLVIFALQLAAGVANYYGYLGWGSGGYVSNDTIVVAGEQVTFWQNYTPTYSQYGIPVSTDSRTFMNFVYSVLNGTGAALMSLGAPPEFARLMNTLVWAVEGAMLLYLLLGREV